MKGYFAIKDLKRFYVYFKPYKKLLLYIMGIMFIFAILNLPGPLINKYVVDEFFMGKNINALYAAIAIQAALFIFTNIFFVSKEYLSAYIGNFITLSMRKNAFQNILRVRADMIKRINIGDVFMTFKTDIHIIEQTVTKLLLGLILNFFNFAMLSVIILCLSWQYFLVSFIIVPFYVMNNNFWVKPMMKYGGLVRESVGRMFDYTNQSLHNLKGIKILGREKYFEAGFIGKNRSMIENIFKSSRLQWASHVFGNFFGLVDGILIMALSGWLFYTGKITVGAYIALTAYNGQCRSSFMQLINFNINMVPVITAMDRLDRFYKIPQEENVGEKVSKIEGNIEFRNVDFEYDPEKPVLRNFNLTIKKGEKIAFVGESGSGKSTITNLILGLYGLKGGAVFIDGKNVEKLNKFTYRKKIGVVTQDNYFFHDTIRNNLTLGKKVKDRDVAAACEAAQIAEHIKASPEGFDTIIDPNAGNLSGGQKQRMSIARMLVSNPDIVILDEATSALDNITEYKIQKELEAALKEKTVIMVAHRLSTIENADRIIVLKNGRIIEEGRHEELVKMGGYYYSLTQREDSEENG